MKIYACLLLVLLYTVNGTAQRKEIVENGDFEYASLRSWQQVGEYAGVVSTTVHSGQQSLEIRSGSSARLKLALQPGSTYKMSAWVKTSSGSGEIQVRITGLGPHNISVASAVADWTEVTQTFVTGAGENTAVLEVFHPDGPVSMLAWADDIQVIRTGDFVAAVEKGIQQLPQRQTRLDQGVRQQPDEKMNWLLDARFGMFIHWGLYAGPGKGEWYMENNGIAPEDYRKLAYPSGGNQQFIADSVNTDEWARLAKEAGMKYMCFTTMHHDGYALFDSHYMDAFTTRQTHNRDFVSEYVNSCRKYDLRVGLYKTLINWRYPGYYDVTGTRAAKNKFGYTADPLHKENARLMKEGLYADIKQLMTGYGKIDYLFWDGGWLGQQGGDAAAAYFWESGKYLDTANAWPVNHYFRDEEQGSSRPLGLMGMIRKYQPDIIVNPRSGWYGDFMSQEGSAMITGPVRTEEVWEKCMSVSSSWGYSARMEDTSKMVSIDFLKRMLSDCIIRNMALLLNVGPDRHGVISKAQQYLLSGIGKWVHMNAEAVYGTRGGPWNPRDGYYGYACKNNIIYLFLLEGFKDASFSLPALNPGQKLVKAYRVSTREPVKATQKKGIITVQAAKKDRVAEIIAIELNKPVAGLKPPVTNPQQ